MPVKDGIEAVCDIMKYCEEMRIERPYVVAITAHAFWSDRVRCMEVGMSDFVSKPASLNDIKSAIERFLRKRTGMTA